MWMRECALHTAAADEELLSCEWMCPLHTAAADKGLLSCEWESVLYTRQPLMRGCYHVNERVCSTHGSRWCGAVIMWMRECALHTAAADEGLLSCEWKCPLHTAAADEGLVSCEWVRSQVIVLCTWQNTALRQGATCLDSGLFRAPSATTWAPFAPASPLGSPHRHGRGTWEAGLMSCPAGSTGERNADI